MPGSGAEQSSLMPLRHPSLDLAPRPLKAPKASTRPDTPGDKTMSWKNPLWIALRRGSRRAVTAASRPRSFRPAFDSLEDRSLPAPFTPGNLIVLQAGTGATGQTTGQLFLNEYTT